MRDAAKQKLVDERKAARQEYLYREEGSKMRSFKCFWTRPFGHKYDQHEGSWDNCFCVGCGKRANTYDGQF